MVVVSALQALADAIALGRLLLQGALCRGAAGRHGAGGDAGIKQAPVEQHPSGPIAALGVEAGDEGGALAAAVDLDHRRRGLGGLIATAGVEAKAGQQLSGAAIGLAQQGLACGLQGLQLRVVLEAAHDCLLKIQWPGGLQAHRLLGLEGHAEGNVDQVAQPPAAAEHLGISLLKPETALLKHRLGPQQIHPGHEAHGFHRHHLVEDHPIVVEHHLADATQLVSELEPVIGLAHIQLQLPQPIGITLAGLLQVRLHLPQGGAALETHQLVVEPQQGKAGAAVGLVAIPATGGHIERRAGAKARHIGVALPGQIAARQLAVTTTKIQAEDRVKAALHRPQPALLLADAGCAGLQGGVVLGRQGDGLLQVQRQALSHRNGPWLGRQGGGRRRRQLLLQLLQLLGGGGGSGLAHGEHPIEPIEVTGVGLKTAQQRLQGRRRCAGQHRLTGAERQQADQQPSNRCLNRHLWRRRHASAHRPSC